KTAIGHRCIYHSLIFSPQLPRNAGAWSNRYSVNRSASLPLRYQIRNRKKTEKANPLKDMKSNMVVSIVGHVVRYLPMFSLVSKSCTCRLCFFCSFKVIERLQNNYTSAVR